MATPYDRNKYGIYALQGQNTKRIYKLILLN